MNVAQALNQNYSVPAPVNTTGSAAEGFVDKIAAQVQGFFGRTVQVLNQDALKAGVEKYGTHFAAALCCLGTPLVSLVSFAAGVVFGSFSKEQVVYIKDSLNKISQEVPQSGLIAGAVMFAFARILIPVTAGLYLGTEIGGMVNPSAVNGFLAKTGVSNLLAPKATQDNIVC